MVSDKLLAVFEQVCRGASSRSKWFKNRVVDGEEVERIFGGYNLLLFGDFNQFAPLPPGEPLYVPRVEMAVESDAEDPPLQEKRAAGSVTSHIKYMFLARRPRTL